MIVLMHENIKPNDPCVAAVCEKARLHHVVPEVHVEEGARFDVVEVYLKDTQDQRCHAVPDYPFRGLPGVKQVTRVSPARVSLRTNGDSEPRHVKIGNKRIGQGLPCIPVLGPCTIDKRVDNILRLLSDMGIKDARAGGRKPRSSVEGFRGFGVKGWEWFLSSAKEHGMESVWTEVIESEDVETLLRIKDMVHFDGDLVLWVGARNTGNYRLLETLGKHREVVAMIKNGLHEQDVDSWFTRAEFVVCGPMYWDEEGVLDEGRSMESGNDRLILCVRGLQHSDPHNRLRFYPNYDWITEVHDRSWVPVCFDPSHIAGDDEKVFTVLGEALQRYPDTVLIEVHSNPPKALCDQDQAIPIQDVPRILDMIEESNIRYTDSQPQGNAA